MTYAQLRPATEERLEVAKGLTIFVRSWRPDDPKAVQVMNADPLIAHETQPTKTLAEMVRADERLKREFPYVTLPVLILHGTADQATKPSGSKRFFDTAGSQDKTLKLYDGHFHDLLNDLDKEVVMADIKDWIVRHLRG